MIIMISLVDTNHESIDAIELASIDATLDKR